MISRREVLLAALGLAVLPAELLAKSVSQRLDWNMFYAEMKKLAEVSERGIVSQRTMAKRALSYIEQLDIRPPSFSKAVEDSFETGNRFWLWQRLVKERNLNGGILNIDRENFVQLHDHPYATGILKIISGEVEVWQFDRIVDNDTDSRLTSELKRTSHHVLRPGEVAVLHPDSGNIHGLKSISEECSMLDFFIPPYQRSERSWYKPLDSNWFDKKQITCERIPQHEYTMI